MSNNCLVTKLKGVVDNDNLPIYGMAKAYVDTTGANENVPITLLGGSSVGIKIISGGTFTDGTTEITTDTVKYVAPNTKLTLLYPKYTCVLSINSYTNTPNHSYITYNLDDTEYTDIAKLDNMIMRLFPNDNPHEGNLANFITKYANSLKYLSFSDFGSHPNIVGDISTIFRNEAALEQVTISNSKVSGNISNAFVGNVMITAIKMRNTLVEGNIETLISNLLQSDKAAFKARTNSLTIDFYSTNTSSAFNLNGKAYRFTFTGTSTVNISDLNDNPIGTYDIDTNTFSINS